MIMSEGRVWALSVVGGVCALAIGVGLGSWRAQTGGWLLVMADAFTLSAVSVLSLAVLILIARSGFFDLFLYGTRRLVGLVIPPLGIYRESFYDYKTARGGRVHASLLPTLTVGGILFGISLIFTLAVGV